ncbi:hypothetical protein [Arthrobacter sp. Hiyo1]|uniref:hypothetical protein n=1 Tax=Arthrobacter sp. Hiyo1 TaxID=1588020 RepID=UPI000B2CA29C|nr:hypothetical protein [Arthrobacter sp. Hiyo1]
MSLRGAVYFQKLMRTTEHEEELRLKYQLHRVTTALEYREQVRDGGIIQDEEGRQKP